MRAKEEVCRRVVAGMAELERRVQERTMALRASHRALAESEEKYRRLFETISDAAFVFDGRTRRFVEVNEAALRLYGYSRQEFLRLRHGVVTADPEGSEASIQLTLRGAAPRIPLRYHRKKDGTIFPVEISGSTFVWRGRPMVCGMVRDISRRVELEREILSISEQEKRRLGQDLHDDLCQQLAGIEFLSQALVRASALQAGPAATHARDIHRLACQAVHRVRELARGLAPVGLSAEGLSGGLRELAGRTEEIFSIPYRFECKSPVMLSDHAVAIHLYRIAQEAVGNAVKHARASRIRISLAANGSGLRLFVRDNGVGIPRKELNRGKGLGLRTMRYRAEVLGGRLTFHREPGGGTSVICAVPARKDP